MTIIDKNWLKVNLSEAERQLEHWQKRLEDLRSASRLLTNENKKEVLEQNNSEITQADLKYLDTYTQSQGRIKLFKEVIRRKGKPLHYKDDFWDKIHSLGDEIKKDSFYIVLRKNADKFGLEKKGQGTYGLK